MTFTSSADFLPGIEKCSCCHFTPIWWAYGPVGQAVRKKAVSPQIMVIDWGGKMCFLWGDRWVKRVPDSIYSAADYHKVKEEAEKEEITFTLKKEKPRPPSPPPNPPLKPKKEEQERVKGLFEGEKSNLAPLRICLCPLPTRGSPTILIQYLI
jgi:hypothetical protein